MLAVQAYLDKCVTLAKRRLPQFAARNDDLVAGAARLFRRAEAGTRVHRCRFEFLRRRRDYRRRERYGVQRR